MNPPSQVGRLGDLPNDDFRERLHEMADWIADYREHIAERPIAPNDKPGVILAQLDGTPPESSTSLDVIFSDIERVIVPGVSHWAHPQFMSYFGCTTTNPGILAEMITAALNVNAMTLVTISIMRRGTNLCMESSFIKFDWSTGPAFDSR